jgi:DNA-binding GntR family transcriptional regulator
MKSHAGGAIPPTTIRPTRLQRELAQRIAQAMRGGTFLHGEHLSEKVLTEKYAVSRTPVRGALKLLAEQGLVDFRPNSGYFVVADGEATALPPAHMAQPETVGMTADDLNRRIIDDRSSGRLNATFTDSDLLQRYGIPRSVLVKTLVRMAADGLIEKRQGHGWRFPMSLRDTAVREESYRFRTLIECGGLLEPAFTVDKAILARMRAQHHALLAEPGPGPGTISPTFFELNLAFHEMVAQFSNNRFILQSVQQQNQLRQLDSRSKVYPKDHLARKMREHLDIMDAIEVGDQEWAVAIMKRHLRAVHFVS